MATACGVGIVWCCLAAMAAAQQIQWQSDLETAKQLAASTNRLVLLHFSASWCHWCKPLEKNVFAQPEAVQAIEANYVAVRMDYDEHRQIAKQYGVKGVPWDVIITPAGYWVEDFNSPQTADKYAARVSKVASREAGKLNASYASHPPQVQQPMVQHQMPPQQQPIGQHPPMAQTQPTAQQYAGAAAPVAQPGMPAANVAQPSAGTQRQLSDDRYADYFARKPAPRVDAVAPPYAQQVTPPGANAQAGLNPPAGMPPAGAPANSQDRYAQAGSVFGPPPMLNQPNNPVAAETSPPPASTAPVEPSGFCLDGHCPVHLMEQGTWAPGDRRFGAHHLGKTYLFMSENCQKKFLADPDRYAPVLSGNDPVALVDHGQSVAGRREHGCYFGVDANRRIVLFANEGSFQAFKSNPQRYASQILAAPK